MDCGVEHDLAAFFAHSLICADAAASRPSRIASRHAFSDPS